MKLSWAQEQRQDWIAEMVCIYGFINREHVVRKFRISVPQAAMDFAIFLKTHKGIMAYDAKAKCCRLCEGVEA